MNTKRFVIASIAAFVFVFAFEFIVHAILLKGVYDATISVWRPEEECNMAFMVLSQFSYAVVMAYIFVKHFKTKKLNKAVNFGLLMGLILGTVNIGTYVYLPIPLHLTFAWVIASLAKGIGVGVVLSKTYK